MTKSTHVVVTPGSKIDSFKLTLSTIDENVSCTLNKFSKPAEITGTYGWFPSPFSDFGKNILDAAWQVLMLFGGRMDVVAAFTDKIVISVNNPTFGYPYTVFVDTDNGSGGYRYNYYEGESHTYVDSKGRSFRCTRNSDSSNKEFTIEAVC
jgi:hypothetical protein